MTCQSLALKVIRICAQTPHCPPKPCLLDQPQSLCLLASHNPWFVFEDIIIFLLMFQDPLIPTFRCHDPTISSFIVSLSNHPHSPKFENPTFPTFEVATSNYPYPVFRMYKIPYLLTYHSWFHRPLLLNHPVSSALYTGYNSEFTKPVHGLLITCTVSLHLLFQTSLAFWNSESTELRLDWVKVIECEFLQ